LQPDDVRSYARHALSTWGDDREFRHYLPRLCELLTIAPHWTDAALLIGKLHPDWQNWPEDERSAVVQFLNSLWDWAIRSSPDTIAARDVLRGSGLAGLDLSPFLDCWHRADTHASAVQLASFVLIEEPELQRGRVGNFWQPKDREQVLRFLLAPETRAKLEAASRAEPDHPNAQDLSDALDVLDGAFRPS
jgi:hypothetical protein